MDIIKIYNLLNPNGDKLQLRLGIFECTDGPKDAGFRWSFVGAKIPMPVRSDTWFNGFPENIMLDWLKENGWLPHTCVNLESGEVKVYEPSWKGNKSSSQKGNEHDPKLKQALEKAITLLANDDCLVPAARVYSYLHDCSKIDALNAVREMARNLTSAE